MLMGIYGIYWDIMGNSSAHTYKYLSMNLKEERDRKMLMKVLIAAGVIIFITVMFIGVDALKCTPPCI